VLGQVSAKPADEFFYPYRESWRKPVCYPQRVLVVATLWVWMVVPALWPCIVSAGTVEESRDAIVEAMKRATKAMGGNMVLVTGFGGQREQDGGDRRGWLGHSRPAHSDASWKHDSSGRPNDVLVNSVRVAGTAPPRNRALDAARERASRLLEREISSPRMKKIVILGGGGFAREAYWHLKEQYDDFAFVDDITQAQSLSLGGKSFPVIKDWDFRALGFEEFLVGVGSPRAKMVMVEKAIKSGLTPAPTFIHPRALVQDAVIGVGGIITPGCVITTNVKIGDYVLLNLNSTVGHDAVIGHYVTINPGCSVSGNTTIQDATILGTGTVTREQIAISSGVTTGAQAAVVSNLDTPGVYVGVPAKRRES
jgi:sugar O-acyltransferase (sialic acid O-acetyltransferase NeuD family)